MGLWRLTKGMVIHTRGLLLEYVTHRRVTKNHYRYKIERLQLVGSYKLKSYYYRYMYRIDLDLARIRVPVSPLTKG